MVHAPGEPEGSAAVEVGKNDSIEPSLKGLPMADDCQLY